MTTETFGAGSVFEGDDGYYLVVGLYGLAWLIVRLPSGMTVLDFEVRFRHAPTPADPCAFVLLEP